MFYEVQIPTGGQTRTMQIEAPSWRAAFTTGIAQTTGSAPSSLEGIFVDLGGDVITVTHQQTRSQVRIRQLEQSNVRQSQILKAVSGTHRSVPEERPKKPSATAGQRSRPVGFKDRATGAFRSIVSTEIKKQTVESGISGRVVADTVAPTEQPSDSLLVERPGEEGVEQEQSVSETALEDVFLEIMAIFEPNFAMEDAIDFVIDLAKKYVPSAVGGLLFASDDADHLYFAQARGASRKKLLKAQLSIRKGIPAACLKDGVSIAAIPGADARSTPELAEAGGFELSSICCAPIQSGPRAFGVLMLANREERSFYSQYDANILTYIGSQMGKFIQDQLDTAPLD